jgi:uroporphyrinogen-III synthase
MRILITRAKPWAELVASLGGRFELVFCPFIDFKYIPILSLPKTDWIFFTSPTSVEAVLRCFTAQQIAGYRLAAMGKGTARQLKERGLEPIFTGQGNRTEAIGVHFGQVVGNESVFFPIASRTLQRVQNKISNAVEQEVYETVIQDNKAPKHDAILFTSPSNVEGFLRSNALPSANRIFALGPATAQALKKKCILLGDTAPENIAKEIIRYLQAVD